MRLPHSLLSSPFFTFESKHDFLSAFGYFLNEAERTEIDRLCALQLLPITSQDAVALMLGVNSGLIWSFIRRPHRYYDQFAICSGAKKREILAPRVSLKIVQKWISVHLQKTYKPPQHVFGFVPGRSHVDAAKVHCEARWVFSFDIQDFFPSTPSHVVNNALQRIGYGQQSSVIIASLCTLDGYLVQGAPSSPVLSNIVFSPIDEALAALATETGTKLTRYADDIVFSGGDIVPEDMERRVRSIFEGTPWGLSERKSKLFQLPNRLKVHGLLVHEAMPRLTKGYRNKIRAFRHMLAAGKVKDSDVRRLLGHIEYADHVSSRAREGSRM